jgi:hypothetical protein
MNGKGSLLGSLFFTAILATTLRAEDFGVTNDLWDVHSGTVVTATSGVMSESSPGLFGGGGYVGEHGDTLFEDGKPAGFVHFAEWRTPAPVSVSHIRLYASGDGDTYSNGREMARFTLKIKSPGSTTFDTTVLTFVPTHPYTQLGQKVLILDATIDPVVASEFRGEFEQVNLRAAGWNAPRVIELDAFGAELPPPPPPPISSSSPSSDDLWDVSRGTTVTRSSAVFTESDGPGLFGGGGYVAERGDTIFADNSFSGYTATPTNHWPYPFPPPPMPVFVPLTNGYVHFVEWKTVTPVTVSSLHLFASGDGEQYSYGREMGRFTLKIKSPGSADFDTTVFTFAPQHPYVFLNSDTQLILDTNIPPITAQEFRGEFEQLNQRAEGYNAPRVIELDAFGPPPSPLPLIFGQPVSTTVWAGTDASFSVRATGAAPLTYTWKHAGTNVTLSSRIESSGALLRIHNATLADSGEYSVVVSNSAGQAESNPATLTVNADSLAPVIAISSPISGSVGVRAIRLAGTLTDNVSVVSARWEQNGALGGSLSVSNRNFSVPVTLQTGTNVLRVIALDAAGNEGSAQVAVALSPTAQSSEDLWDIGRGTIVTRSSSVYTEVDGPGLFGGGGFVGEPGDTLFSDDNYHSVILVPGFPGIPGYPTLPALTNATNVSVIVQTNGYVHFVEWKTVEPVTVSKIRLFASGDGETYSYGREMGRFTLKTKSAGSTNFDLTVMTFVPSHPYAILDAASSLIMDTNLPAFTAQEFRAEFEQLNLRAAGWNAPRVMELDAFGPIPTTSEAPHILAAAPRALTPANFAGAVTFAEDGTPHLVLTGDIGATYLIQASSDLVNWTDLGAYVCADGTIQVNDSAGADSDGRFYKAVLIGH